MPVTEGSVPAGGDIRFPGATPRTDFAEQVAAGRTNRSVAPPTTSEWVVDLPNDTPTTVKIADDPSYSSEQRDQYRVVRTWAKEAFGFGSVADVDSRTKWAADKFKDEFGRYPSATELWSYQPYQDTLGLLASGGAYMEPYFGYVDENGGTQWVINNGLEWTQPSVGSLLAGTGAIGSNLQNLTVHPDLGAVLASLSPVSTGGRGGGSRGGGGAGRAEMVFDRAKLAEEVTNRWRGLLLEEPDDATRNKIVNGYITDANGFWMNEAGQLDFDTYVVDKIRAQDRYSFLYEKKPEFQSEAEYMSGFRQTVGQFGMNDRATLREVEAGAHSGAGLQGFGERVSRTAEVRASTGGSYSQRFASTMAQSGLGRT